MKTSCRRRRRLPPAPAARSVRSGGGRSPCRPPIACRWANSPSPSPSTCRHRRRMNLTKQATLKLIVRNTGVGDAFNVRVDDELPDGLKFISSQPEMKRDRRRPAFELAPQPAAGRLRSGDHDQGPTDQDRPIRSCRHGHVRNRLQVANHGAPAPAQGRHHRQPDASARCSRGSRSSSTSRFRIPATGRRAMSPSGPSSPGAQA